MSITAIVENGTIKLHVRLCSAFPLREVFAQAHRALRRAAG